MKEYQDVLIALSQDGTPNSRQNKFAKFSVVCKDEMLKQLCSRVATMYSYYIKPRYSRSIPVDDPRRGNVPINNYEWSEMQRVVNTELRDYVTMRLKESKPSWQVMAEKNGWRPPQ